MLGNCKILKYNAFYGCVVRENEYGIHSRTRIASSGMRHQHLALVATRLGPDVGDLCQMRPSGTRMNAICIYCGVCLHDMEKLSRSKLDMIKLSLMVQSFLLWIFMLCDKFYLPKKWGPLRSKEHPQGPQKLKRNPIFFYCIKKQINRTLRDKILRRFFVLETYN